MPTPHIDASNDAFADTVLLPGDPLRARHIAEHYLDEVSQVTGLRNMCGFTGRYRGQRLSVMGSGMGIPSLSIYATELARHYRVRRLIRVGTCAAVRSDLPLGTLVLALAAGTDSRVNRLRFGGHDMPAACDVGLLRQALATADRLGQTLHVGSVFSTDLFYDGDPALPALLARQRVLAVEMETAGLYGMAPPLDVAALSLLAVSDNLESGATMPAQQRERSLDALARLALETAIAGLPPLQRAAAAADHGAPG
jgi:purine-nucleoside phosphorylase